MDRQFTARLSRQGYEKVILGPTSLKAVLKTNQYKLIRGSLVPGQGRPLCTSWCVVSAQTSDESGFVFLNPEE